MPWRGPSICLAGATCYLTRPNLCPTAACSIRPCPGQQWPKATCQQAPADGQPPVWWPPLLGRVGWVRRKLVPFRWLPNWGAILPIECLFWDQWETAVFGQILAGCSQKQPESSWKQAVGSSQEQSPAARSREEQPEGARPGAARTSQKQPGAARSSQEQPEEARSSQKKPGAARSSQKQPKAARSSQEPRARRPGTTSKVPGFRVYTFVIATSVRVITS